MNRAPILAHWSCKAKWCRVKRDAMDKITTAVLLLALFILLLAIITICH